MLVKRHNEWFIAYANEHISGVNLAASYLPRHDAHLFRKSTQGTFFANFQEPDDIVFFPKIYYRGKSVYPQSWHPNSSELLLLCVTGSDSWKKPIHTEADLCTMIEELKKDGWAYNPKDQEAHKYIHIDELEKIKGPSPEGVF